MKKYPAQTDVAVLLLFFTRSDTFQKVFNEVRRARPSRLFLFQDGARGERDLAGIEACRKIVADENIDWECDVHRNYQQQTLFIVTVKAQEICDALKAQHGIDIEKNKIVQADPIKTFGSYTVKAKLGYEVNGTINVLVIEEK